MKKLYVLAVMLLASVLIAEAGQVNEQQAREKAKTFLTKRSLTRGVSVMQRVYVPLKTPSAMESVNDAPLYLFNLEGGGYVVVSGDDRTVEILAFSEKGHTDPDKMPLNMKNWMDGYVRKIQKLPAHIMPQQRAVSRSVKADLQPKLKTAWGQDWPYNLHSPKLHVEWNGKESTVLAATGCIATSMAQMLNYYRYPNATLTGADSYKGVADVPVSDNVNDDVVQVAWKTEAMEAGSVIDWANITNTYDQNSTEAQTEAVSRLVQYCGLAANTQYGTESSAGTDEMVYALYDTFGYEDVYMLYQMNYDAQGWVDVLYDVMSQEGPLLFGADLPDDNGGHQFIIDGYRNVDGQDYFYANWGWDGEDDGYMALDVMSPGWIFDDNGKEIGFTDMQMATPGMGPEGKGKTSIKKILYCDEFALGREGKVYERFSSSDGFDVEYAFYYTNLDHPNATYLMGMGTYQNDRLVSGINFSGWFGVELPFFYTWGGESESEDDLITVGQGLGDGTYQIKPICTTPDNTIDWDICRFADYFPVTMTITGNKATFSGSTQTSIRSVTNDVQKASADTGWHNLSGMRLNGAPSAKGIYIHNGKKIVVK